MESKSDLLGLEKEKYRLIAENEFSVCVHDFAPLCFGHCLVLPKRNITKLSELNEKEAKAILDLIDQVSLCISKATNKQVIVSKNMGQFITYPEKLHFHLLPSEYKLGQMFETTKNIKKVKSRKREVWQEEELKKASEKIKSFL
jgi:diadenosine tetraphosphate (Ap4A) HIT family hydrolase